MFVSGLLHKALVQLADLLCAFVIELLNEFLTIFNFQVLNYYLQIGYDRRVRPNYGNSPVFVKVSLYVLSVEVIADRGYCISLLF